jgi:RNA-directed DNA polymerase
MTDITKSQQSLARKAEAEPIHRFEDLYFLLCKTEWIEAALQHVLSNDGAKTPGVDGMSGRHFNDVQKSDFDNEQFRAQFIAQLQADLKGYTFRPLPVRRVEIPKPGTDKKRPLGIPTIKDRVVQMLLKMVLEPIWEADFCWFSNGFRPTRCTMDCIQPLYKLFNNDTHYTWVIEGDIRAFFDRIPHDRLLLAVERRIADQKVLTLIRRFLKSGVMREGTLVPTEEGSPQGGIASPLLANVYLHQFDVWFVEQYACPAKGKEAWRRERVKGGPKAAAQLFRYADDWIILVRGTKSQAQDIMARCKAFLEDDLGLELSEEKTTITHVTDGFDFLGFHIFRNITPRNGRRVGTFVRPADKCLKRVKLKVKEMTNRRTQRDDEVSKLRALNAVIRGWANYYRAVNAYKTLADLDRYVWLRLQKWLQGKYCLSPRQVDKRHMRRRAGPRGGELNFAAYDASTGNWVWRYLATDTRLVHYRPRFKQHWPNPFLEQVKVEPYELPTLKTMWTGNTDAPRYEAARRVVLGRAKGVCERCGRISKLTAHHIHRVGRGTRDNADNRPEMLQALCQACQTQEHRAENISRAKNRLRSATGQWVKASGKPGAR